jgi:putative SOS response-associated peptidase YedK
MCTRFTFHQPDRAMSAIAAALAKEFAAPPEPLRARWNVTLTHVMPAVAAGEAGLELRSMVWGMVPAYARSQPTTASCSQAKPTKMLPNAKAETAATLYAFKSATARRRCLIPANGFYEWQAVGKLKLPHLFTLRDEEPLAFAGIWEPGGEADVPETFAILTTAPNALVMPIHNRMPVILTAETMPRWLGSEPLPEAEYRALTQPLPADRMQERPVSRFVSNSRHEGSACHAPPEEQPPELAFL